jgi:hypothetical protein
MELLLLPPQGSARRLRRREGGADGESIGTNRWKDSRRGEARRGDNVRQLCVLYEGTVVNFVFLRIFLCIRNYSAYQDFF